ncbi:MAG: aryl-sulfate sulfotransferase [Planctomycetota bacterium]
MMRDCVFALLALLSVTPCAWSIAERTVGLLHCDPNALEGYTLFAPQGSQTTYLIDVNGRFVHSWSSDYKPGLSVYLLENGSILRTGFLENQTFPASGAGGCVQEIQWDGAVAWEFKYASPDHLLHHDIEKLPNGNVLMIAWERKTSAEAIEAGRDPAFLDDGELWPDHIIEVRPAGPLSGEIVWEWHMWDHLVQDYDASKANYGVVEDHPELLDINYLKNRKRSNADWMHTNSIAYNAQLDQILISVNGTAEIYVIDHNTTTAEAAGHTGGRAGRGGDILYRWGNAQVYRAGESADKKFFGQHDAQWIGDGLPGQGNILVFNNGLRRPDGEYSTVEEIVPPVDSHGNYSLIPGSAYEPVAQEWIYMAEPPTALYSKSVSGAQRLANGNTLICSGSNGTFVETDPEGRIVWRYVNPVTRNGIVIQGEKIPLSPSGSPLNTVFKCRRYAPDFPALAGRDLTDAGPIEGCPIDVDIDGDCRINLVDISVLAEHWRMIDCGDCGQADLTGDQKVDAADLAALGAGWLTGFW